MAETATESTRVSATGTVTQTIPPEKHGKYSINPEVKGLAAGELIITFDAREDHGGILDYLRDLREWFDDPTTTTDGVYHAMAATGSLDEGDELTLELERTDVDDFWRVVSIERGESDV